MLRVIVETSTEADKGAIKKESVQDAENKKEEDTREDDAVAKTTEGIKKRTG
jgi:hypothetical protein